MLRRWEADDQDAGQRGCCGEFDAVHNLPKTRKGPEDLIKTDMTLKDFA
jgi:hypothetical protein